jgi:hypothetical protein
MGSDEPNDVANQHAADAADPDFVLHKPQVDNLQYRFVTLENSLKALLICDPETDKAAASMDVCHPRCRHCAPFTACTSNLPAFVGPIENNAF